MAEIKLYRIDILVTDAAKHSFTAGDVIEIYLDNTDVKNPAYPLEFASQGVRLYLNGVLNTDTSNYFPLTPLSDSSISVQFFNPIICVSTTLVTGFGMWMIFPFTYYYTIADHYSCAVNPPTCDLIVLGVPEVTPATSSTATDGAILITGQSTLSIQYKLGSDFVYDDGTAQTDGDFQGLIAGSYRIFLRDSANCQVNILVTVAVDNSYGVIYRNEYYDLRGLHTKWELCKRGYSGSVTEVNNSGTPLTIALRGEGSQNKFEPIQAGQSVCEVVDETDGQFEDIYTNDRNLYRLKYYKDFGNTLPAFTPDTLDALNLWSETGAGSEWSDTTTPSVTVGGVASSEIKYTSYTFEEGEEYTFNYNFQASAGGVTVSQAILTIDILDSSGNTLNVKKEISFRIGASLITTPITGSYVFDAPPGAARIALYVTQNASSTITYTVNSFTNGTASRSETAAGYEQLITHKVIPQNLQQLWKAPPSYVQISATDGLKELETFYLIQDDGQKYYGTISLIKLVSYCLSKIGLDLPIRIACNLYALDMDQNDYDDPFDQAYIDFECFYLAEKEPTLDFVMRSILEPFGCCIKQWENRWNIVRVEEQAAEYDYRDFDSAGEYLTHGTFDPVIEIGYPAQNGEILQAEGAGNIEQKPGYGQIKGIYKLGLKPNILDNGDFRLKSTFAQGFGYLFSINTDGFTIVTAGYPINQGTEDITQENIALTLSSEIFAALESGTGGEAYVQSDQYFVRMGTNNQLKISVRYKITSASVQFGDLVYRINVPYTKVRIQVLYGSLYLQADGSWTSTPNTVVFFETKYGEFIEREVLANQPTDEAPTSGMQLSVRVFQPFGFYSEFDDVNDLKAFQTYDSPDFVLPTGYLTELIDDATFGLKNLYYFKLTETTEAENLSGYSIVRPNDYNGVSNPRQWVRYDIASTGDVGAANSFTVSIDRIKVVFLTDGKDPLDTIIRIANAEINNREVLEKKVIIGSQSDLIATETDYSIAVGIFFPNAGAGLTLTTRNILSSKLIYTGWLRDADGNGFEYFKRDGVAEEDKLHGIMLKQYAAQYKKSWRLLRSSFKANTRFFGFLNVAKDVNDSNRIYIPSMIELNDRRTTFSVEFLEMRDVLSSGGSDGSTEAPFTSGFSSGFGKQAFN